MGNFEEGTEKVKEITRSLKQTYYQLGEGKMPCARADVHLTEKAKVRGDRVAGSARSEEHKRFRK